MSKNSEALREWLGNEEGISPEFYDLLHAICDEVEALEVDRDHEREAKETVADLSQAGANWHRRREAVFLKFLDAFIGGFAKGARSGEWYIEEAKQVRAALKDGRA